MSDDLPPMPGYDDEDSIDYSDVPIRVQFKDDTLEMTYGEAMELMSRLSTTMEVWWRINGGK